MAETTTQFAVLGLVARGPTHGYALAEQISRWPTDAKFVPSVSAVYKNLRRLSEIGWIEPLDTDGEAEPGRPGRTRYATTVEGQARFDEWIRRTPKTYEDLCARLATARREDIPVILAHVEAAERAYRQELQGAWLPSVASLAARDAPWDVVLSVLVGQIASAEVTARATILHELVQTLRDLPEPRPMASP